MALSVYLSPDNGLTAVLDTTTPNITAMLSTVVPDVSYAAGLDTEILINKSGLIGTDPLLVFKNGGVGIGNNDPQGILHLSAGSGVVGLIIQGSVESQFMLSDGTTWTNGYRIGRSYWPTSANNFFIYDTTADALKFLIEETGHTTFVMNHLAVGGFEPASQLADTMFHVVDYSNQFRAAYDTNTYFNIDVNATGVATLSAAGIKLTGNLGLYNTTPIAQPAHVADATGAGDIVAQFNTLLTRLEALGILASA